MSETRNISRPPSVSVRTMTAGWYSRYSTVTSKRPPHNQSAINKPCDGPLMNTKSIYKMKSKERKQKLYLGSHNCKSKVWICRMYAGRLVLARRGESGGQAIISAMHFSRCLVFQFFHIELRLHRREIMGVGGRQHSGTDPPLSSLPSTRLSSGPEPSKRGPTHIEFRPGCRWGPGSIIRVPQCSVMARRSRHAEDLQNCVNGVLYYTCRSSVCVYVCVFIY